MKTAVLIPTFGRAQRVSNLVANIKDTTPEDHEIYFIIEKHDDETVAAVEAADAKPIFNPGGPSYASCINAAYNETSEPFFFLGADDLSFTPGWLSEALKPMDDSKIGLVGSRDPNAEFSDHPTHYLIRRQYIDDHGGCLDSSKLNGDAPVLFPYHHNWTDWECVITAKVRDAYAFSENCIVNHIHPGWDAYGHIREDHELYDQTYAKANKYADEDWNTLIERSKLWLPGMEARRNKTDADWYIIGYARYGLTKLQKEKNIASSGQSAPQKSITFHSQASEIVGHSIVDDQFEEKWLSDRAHNKAAPLILKILKRYDTKIRKALSLTLKSINRKEKSLREELEVKLGVQEAKIQYLLDTVEELKDEENGDS
ncbi:MAG: glycosyltransferase family A protein [Verrucomicrobiota bacterium]